MSESPTAASQGPQRPKGRFARRLVRLGISVFLLGLLMAFLLRFSSVQTWLARRAAAWFSGKYGVQLTLERVDIGLVSGVKLYGLCFLDHNRDTLIQAGYVGVTLGDIRPWAGVLTFRRARVADGFFQLKRRKGEPRLNIEEIIRRIAPPDTTEEDTLPVRPFHFGIKTIELENFGFRLVDEESPRLSSPFQPGDMRIAIEKGLFRSFRVSADSILADIEELKASDHSGLGLEALSCSFGICSTALLFNSLKMHTHSGSEVLGHVRFFYSGYGAMRDFLDSVRLDVALKPSRIHPDDLGYFAVLPSGFNQSFGLSGKVEGPITHLKAPDLFLFLPASTVFEGALVLDGLPDIDRLRGSVDFRRFHTDFGRLPDVLKAFTGVELPAWLRTLGETDLKGTFTGTPHHFQFSGSVNTAWGTVQPEVEFLAYDGYRQARYTALLQLDQLDLSHLPGTSILGRQSGQLVIQGSGLDQHSLKIHVEAQLNPFTLNGYAYDKLFVKGLWEKMSFTGNVELRDPSANLLFSGFLDMGGKVPRFDCEARIFNTDLKVTRWLDEPFEIDEIVLKAKASGSDVDNFTGSVFLSPVRFCKAERSFAYTHFSLEADTAHNGRRRFALRSPYVDADFGGYFGFESLAHTAMAQLNAYLPSLRLPADTHLVRKNQQVDFRVELKNPDPIIAPWFEDFHLKPGSNISGRFDGRSAMFLTDVIVPGLKTAGVHLEILKLRLSSNQKNFYVNTTLERFYATDSLYFKDIRAEVSAEKDSLQFLLGWQGDSENLTKGFLSASSTLTQPGSYSLLFSNSWVSFVGEDWRLSEGAQVRYDSTGFFFNDRFVFRSPSDANIGLNGKAGNKPTQVLRLLINDFPLDYVNRLAGMGHKTRLGGYISGYVGFFSALNRPRMEADVLIGQISVNKQSLGDLYFKSNYDSDAEEIVLDAFMENHRMRLFSLMGGRVKTDAERPALNLPIVIEKLPMAVLEIFTAPDFKNLTGYINGMVTVRGSIHKPDLEGRVRLDEAGGYMPVIGGRFSFYFPDGAYISLDNRRITVPTLVLTDIVGNKAYLSGEITHQQFSDVRFNLFLDSKGSNFLFFNPTRKESPRFYGSAMARGKIQLKGTPQAVTILAALETSRGTRLFLSLEEGTLVASENTFVTFITSRPESQEKLVWATKTKTRDEEIEATTISLTIEATVTQDAEINLIFNEATNDVLSASGNGNLRLELTPAGDVFIFGDYEVFKGKYLFSLQNLLSKELQLKPGGILTFSGDPTEARINATAFYATRASPAPLVSAAGSDALQSSARNRIPVEVLVHLKGPILEPQVSFDVSFPTVSENTRATYEAVMSSTDEKNKQAFALLVLNQFLTPGSLGSSVSGGGALGSNSLEVISNQLSNLVSKISDDVDVGVRYRQGTKTSSGAGEVEVALSTRLLNDRLVIDGNFGFLTNTRTTSASAANSQNSGSIIDINIEYLLTQDGKLRLKAFNRSNYANLFSPFPYTQGAGLSYQTQFAAWRDVVRPRKKSPPPPQLIMDDDRPWDE
jgi:hypothetical protein